MTRPAPPLPLAAAGAAREIVAVDLGGTHARFALARVEAGRVAGIAEVCTLRTAEHADLAAARDAFEARLGRPLPAEAGLAFAGPVHGEVLRLTNSDWTLRPAEIPRTLGFSRFLLVNDFGAVAHAVASLPDDQFVPIAGPDAPLPAEGVVSLVGPGTGLGVAQLIRRDGCDLVVETEGGHVDFAPLDALEEALLARLRRRYGRVSVERLVSGPGLSNIHAALAELESRPAEPVDNAALWERALGGEDASAAAALDRFCLAFGAVAGDVALTQGADAVVLAGGLGLRLANRLPRSGFAGRFRAKGRFEARMAALPVKLVTYPEPGLLGAAAAFVAKYG